VRPVTFTVPGAAAPKGSKTLGTTKTGRPFARESSKAVGPWQDRVAKAAADAMNGAELLTGELRLSVVFTLVRPKGHYGTGANAGTVKPSAPKYPTTTPDLSKLVRAIEDALQGVVFRNDSLVVEIEAYKVYGPTAQCQVVVGSPFGWGVLP
jgi:Holliday junction resolvase RusA-like endonuclease